MSAAQYLKQCKLFQGISGEEMKLPVPYSSVSTLDTNEYAFGEGDVATAVYSVGTGRVSIGMKFPSEAGAAEESITLVTLGPTEVFGLWALFSPFV